MIRGAIVWIIWLERNNVCFKGLVPTTSKTFGIKIIALTSFWCQSGNDDSFSNLYLIILFDLKELPNQLRVEEEKAVDVLTTMAELEDATNQSPFLATIKEDFDPGKSLSPMSGVRRQG